MLSQNWSLFLSLVVVREPGPLTLGPKSLWGWVSRAGFVSHHFAPNARQDDDEGDQCSQKDGDDDG